MKPLLLALIALSLPALAQSDRADEADQAPRHAHERRQRHEQHGRSFEPDLDLDMDVDMDLDLDMDMDLNVDVQQLSVDVAQLGARLGSKLGRELGNLPELRELGRLGELHKLNGLGRLALRDHDDDDQADDDDDDNDSDQRDERRDREREKLREKARRDMEQVRHDHESARHDAESARHESENARREAEKARREAERARAEHSDGDDTPTGQAAGSGKALLAVKGPVTFRLRAQAGDVEVVQTDKPQIFAVLQDAPREDVRLLAYGDRVEVQIGSRHQLRRGRLHVEVPRGSSVDLSSMSGDISARGNLGEARIRTMSGDVKLGNVGKTDAQSISGDITIEGASGPVRLHTVSGNATIATTQPGAQVEFQSASGNFDWSGACVKDCHVSAETVSGDVTMSVDAKSSFELSYTSHSGDLHDELALAVKHPMKKRHEGAMGGWLEATYGRGEGLIECDAFSGNLSLKKR